MTGYIARDKLTDTLRSHRNTPEIKVLTGVDGAGKARCWNIMRNHCSTTAFPRAISSPVASIPSTRPSDIRRPTCTPT